MIVKNMTSNHGNNVANQFIIIDRGVKYFQSYETIICMVRGGKVYLDRDKWNYSKTTAKYRNMFLNQTSEEVKAKIKSGEYILTDLNTNPIEVLTTEGITKTAEYSDFEFFVYHATDRLKKYYTALEDNNYHTFNAKMIVDFRKWIEAGNKADNFIPDKLEFISWQDTKIIF